MRVTLLALLLALSACGPPTKADGGTDAGDAGPDASVDAGRDGGQGPACADAQKRCTATFTMPYANETSVELRGDFRPMGWTLGVQLARDGGTWSAAVPVPFNTQVQYKYVVNGATWIIDPTNPRTITDGSGNTNSLKAELRCDPHDCSTAFDWRDAVIYFVFVDRFFDADPSNNCNVAGADPAGNFKGGDWKGVTQKINDGYFTDLGVNTLWLTVPVMNTNQAGHGLSGDPHQYSAYHGYWPTELDQAQSCFGTKQELIDLVSAAHAKGLKVLFDYAMVHVHASSTVYAQHSDWFWPNSWNGGNCVCAEGCDWNAQGYRCWFADYLPHWNYTVPAARDYSVNQAVQWVKDTDIDGFRLDAIKHVDGTWLTQLRDRVTHEVVATKNPWGRFYMVGETFDYSNRDYIKSFVDTQSKLDGQFDFPLRDNLLKAVVMRQGGYGLDQLANFLDGNDGYYGADAVMSTWIGNHDLGRIIHMAEDTPMWGEFDDGKNRAWTNQPTLPANRRPFERLANAFTVLFTTRGAPLIYYGDEIGLPGAGDPDNRRVMQFTNLSADQQWLSTRLKALLKIRADHPALRYGTRTTLSITPDSWSYSVTSTDDLVYVAINRSDADLSVTLPRAAMTDLLAGTSVTGPSVVVPARSARVLVRQ